jgi:hypothetical protein
MAIIPSNQLSLLISPSMMSLLLTTPDMSYHFVLRRRVLNPLQSLVCTEISAIIADDI